MTGTAMGTWTWTRRSLDDSASHGVGTKHRRSKDTGLRILQLCASCNATSRSHAMTTPNGSTSNGRT